MKVSLVLNFPHGTRYTNKKGERVKLSIDDIFQVLNSVSPLKTFRCRVSDYYTYEIEIKTEEIPIVKLRKELVEKFWEDLNLVASVTIPKVEFNQRETKSYKIALMIGKVEGKDEGKE